MSSLSAELIELKLRPKRLVVWRYAAHSPTTKQKNLHHKPNQENRRIMNTAIIELPNKVISQSKTSSREIRLVSRPKGIPTAANFSLVETELGATARPAGAGS